MHQEFLFTSESVSEGHPDKICDQISDYILDFLLNRNPYERVAIETFATKDTIFISGEVSCVINDKLRSEIEDIVRDLIKFIGYEQVFFHWQKVKIIIEINQQSSDIALGVDENRNLHKEQGAGDQGLMFGYACNETDQLMPAAIYYSNLILENIFQDIRSKKIIGLGPDAKIQLTLKYKNNKPYMLQNIVFSIQHKATITHDQIQATLEKYLKKLLPENWYNKDSKLYINPTGQFLIGGPESDTGLTGRKIIVDTYGGSAPHGGGAFSGKDPTKVDRSAAYIARYIAKNLVASGLMHSCLIQISYAIGIAEPMSFYIKTDNKEIDTYKLELFIKEIIDLKPKSIREHLQLNKAIYAKTSTYGHFGRVTEESGHFSWEKTDLIETIRANKHKFLL